ncbi:MULTISPECIES: LysR family transcriptional regulator [Rhodopseudomonas]|uniref:LysR family transcriptional regulator n=1 Tax=Rhodopseudomonas palustris TaxID=1076 RepID=A0A0D7EEE7_RHOPL|nr:MULTISPECIES: LysR family transcriptional regulator [Rhodopseudomonas]KIZ38885.1 LysR family transcriptional regulator [Rhodopseudomonas palustris]MDF3810232.1 LysR family transcriptional regulator [Rhodopseudomonas sp. BAL398]WOK18315.1 LysR family transcriptional regulator [Rhodopseudomonas sp. BAL398]
MARLDLNRSGEMEVFIRVVQLGGFSIAARAFRMTPSAVSKLVARLEARLGVRLINRSTRKLQLTPEGTAFYERAVRILDEITAAEREAALGATPSGVLRINSSVPFGLHRLLPLLPDFLQRFPGISVDVTLTDIVVDLLEERADVAIRVGPMRESRLLARKLAESRMVVAAAPAYLATHEPPQTPADLAQHNLLGFGFSRQVADWPFIDGRGGVTNVPTSGNALVGDGEALRQLTIAGAGLARMSRLHIDPDIQAGRLVPVLESYNPGDLEATHAVFVGHGGQLPARVRALLDYLVETVRP